MASRRRQTLSMDQLRLGCGYLCVVANADSAVATLRDYGLTL